MTLRTIMIIGATAACIVVATLIAVGWTLHAWVVEQIKVPPVQPPAVVQPEQPTAPATRPVVPVDPATIAAAPATKPVRIGWAKDGTGVNFMDQSGNPTGLEIVVPVDAAGKLTKLPVYKPDATQLTYYSNTKVAADRNTKVLQQILEDMPDSGGILEIQGDVAINGLILPTKQNTFASNVVIRGTYPGVMLLNLNKDVPAIKNVPNLSPNQYAGRLAYQRLENLNIMSAGVALDITGAGLLFSFDNIAVCSCGQFDHTLYACKFQEMYGWNTGSIKLLGNLCNGLWLENCGDVTFTKITARGNLGTGVGMKYCFGVCGSIDAEANSDWNVELTDVHECALQVWMEQAGWKYNQLTDRLIQGKLTSCTDVTFTGHGLSWEADTLSRATCRNHAAPVGYTETLVVDPKYLADAPYYAWGGANKPVLTPVTPTKYIVSCQDYNSTPPGWVNVQPGLRKVALKAGDVLEVLVRVTGNDTVNADYGKAKKDPAGFFDLSVAGASVNLPIQLFNSKTETIKLRLVVPQDTTGIRLLHMLVGYIPPAAGTTHDYLVELQSVTITR